MINLTLNGCTTYKTKPFPKWPFYDERELSLIQDVVTSQKWWRMAGYRVEELESKFAEYHGVKHCLAMTNGTHAMEAVLAAYEIGKDDEVIIPAFTFISTLTAIIYCNATPVPVDIDPETFCIDINAFEKAITPKTKAVMPVHMAGHCCDMDAIYQIAKKHNIKIIEDAAHAHGAEWKGKKVGAYCDVATFSFQNGKIMTSGEGGAIITNDDELYEKMFLIHGVGRPKNDRLYQHIHLGSNYRMTEFQAAILIAQLERLEKHNAIRDKHAKALNHYLKDIKGIKSQGHKSDANINTHYMYMFYYDSAYFGGLSRQQFVDALIAEGVPAFISFPVVTNTEFFRNGEFRTHLHRDFHNNKYCFPIAEKVAQEVVWLPHYTLLGDEQDLQEIAGAIRKIQDLVK